MNRDESYETIGLILRQIYKDKTGDGEFPVSQVLDVYQKLGNHEDPGDESLVDFTVMAKKQYLEQLKQRNLVDHWKLEDIVNQNLEKFEAENVVLQINQKLDESDKKLFRNLFEIHDKVTLQVELPLDASMTEDVKNFSLQKEEFHEDILDKSSNKTDAAKSQTEEFCKMTIMRYLRLVLNSKDEFSLSKIICSGPAAVLTPNEFHVIKSESGQLSMFQTILSYAQKLKLGGKSYAPTEDHPFHGFSRQLQDFSSLMSKLYAKIEDIDADASKALNKIMTSLKAHLMKSLRQSSVENVIVQLSNEFQSCSKRWPESKTESVTKMLALFTDAVFTSSCEELNLNEMFGVIPSPKMGKTPIACPRLISLYKTPLQDQVQDESVQAEQSTTKIETPKRIKDGMSKFTSSLAWAAETSPLVLNSADRNIRTQGPTLNVAAESSSSTPLRSKVVEQGLKAANEALQEAKREAPKAKKVMKRSIMNEIANVDKWSKIKEESNIKKRKLDLTGVENSQQQEGPKGKKKKEPASKKIKPLPKGQMKMTSFLRV